MACGSTQRRWSSCAQGRHEISEIVPEKDSGRLTESRRTRSRAYGDEKDDGYGELRARAAAKGFGSRGARARAARAARARENRSWARRLGLYRGRTWRGRPGARTAWFGRWSPARFRFKEEEGCGPQLSVAQGGGLALRCRGLPRAGPAVSAQEGGRSRAGLLACWARGRETGRVGQKPGRERVRVLPSLFFQTFESIFKQI